MEGKNPKIIKKKASLAACFKSDARQKGTNVGIEQFGYVTKRQAFA